MFEVIPAILTNSSDEFEKLTRLIEPYSKRIHLDIADGIFVPNETIFGYSEIGLVSSELKFDIHLMVKRPLDFLSSWEAENADRFIVHVESDDVPAAIGELRSMKKSVGLAINPVTSLDDLDHLVGLVDFIHFMTINPGFQGKEFLEQVLVKIKHFRGKYPQVVLAVDGGINLTTAKNAIEAGVNILISGSFILKSGNVGKAIEKLKKISEN